MDTPNGSTPDYVAEVAHARHAARMLRRGAYATAGVGLAAGILAIYSFIKGDTGLDATVEYLWAFGAATVISGVAFYATSWNLALSASRLETQLTSHKATDTQ